MERIDVPGETELEENFEDLLNQSTVGPIRLHPGEKVNAVVTQITQEWVFIDLGGKTEGYIAKSEFVDDGGNITINEGDTIGAYFLSSRNGGMLFATRLSSDATGSEHLEEAYHNQIPVEGLVEKEIKGGFEVKLAGNIQAFCPYSQMGLHRVKDTDQYIGQRLIFKVIEYAEKGRNIILSNRVIQEAERQKEKDLLKERLEEGMIVRGEIISIRKFGAFADIGGIEGLIPVSEISWGRVDDINDFLSVGQKVDVAIKHLDWKNMKFSFSLKEILPDPWNDADLKYPVGSCHTGEVVRLAQFGAFVTLEPGIDGLIHISELGKGKRINHPSEVLDPHQTIDVKISSINSAKKRIALSLSMVGSDEQEADSYKQYLKDSTQKTSGSFNTLGDVLRAKMEKKDR